MTHPYQLHVEVQAQCLCCLAHQSFRFGSASDQVVCAKCLRHGGEEKSERRDREHVTAWAARFAAEQQANTDFAAASVAVIAEKDAELERRGTEVEQLTRIVAGNFEHTASGGVRDLLSGELLTRAERKAELANRRVDWAMAVLWRLGVRHRGDPAQPQLCACGTSLARCAELAMIEPMRQAVEDWEAKNIRLQGDGKRHGLPSDHPAAKT